MRLAWLPVELVVSGRMVQAREPVIGGTIKARPPAVAGEVVGLLEAHRVVQLADGRPVVRFELDGEVRVFDGFPNPGSVGALRVAERTVERLRGFPSDLPTAEQWSLMPVRQRQFLIRGFERYTLRVLNLRTELLQHISEGDAFYSGAERPVLSEGPVLAVHPGGVVQRGHPLTGSYRQGFARDWDERFGGTEFRWLRNPRVWVVEFEVHKKP